MRDLKFVCVQPIDNYFVWQVHLWLESLRKIGHSDKAIVLIFWPNGREYNTNWDKIIELYPEAEFNFYKDHDNVSRHLGVYIPVIRPYCLWRYWQDHPNMKDKAVFYCDCDILFTDKFNIDAFIEDDVCYLSDTNSYINADYFASKENDVLPNKLEEYKQIDVLEEILSVIGITKQTAIDNNLNSGGAQYFLKNIDTIFWEKMIKDVVSIRTYLMSINGQYFENENKGFQSWCADMWALLWNLWFRGHTTRVIPEMNFSWATDSIERVQELPIFHNAGVGAENQGGELFFYKGKYHQGMDPFLDVVHIENVIKHTPDKGTSYYAQALLDLKQKYNLQY